MDLRLPIGGLFTIFGLILTLFGKVANTSIYTVSLGINVNFWWGLVMLIFGLIFVIFGLRHRKEVDPTQ